MRATIGITTGDPAGIGLEVVLKSISSALTTARWVLFTDRPIFERNLARLEANRARAETIGAVRHGPSLLAGLLVCGLCGRRMQVRYGGPNTLHRDTCNRLATDYGGDYCQ